MIRLIFRKFGAFIGAFIFLGMAFFINDNYEKNKEYYRETTAIINDIDVDIRERYDSNLGRYVYEEKGHTVYITYQVDGQLYENIEYNEYWVGMRVGEEITIKYDSRNPTKFGTSDKTNKVLIIFFCVVGSILLAIGIFNLLMHLAFFAGMVRSLKFRNRSSKLRIKSKKISSKKSF